MINIAILGNGTVGAGVVELLNKNKEYIKTRTGRDINISKILVRDIEKHKETTDQSLLTNNIYEVKDVEPDIVVEAIGGLHPAYDYIKDFLKEKKHVVTANKDVIAKYGQELNSIAVENGVSLNYEASVGGGIPILKPIRECLAGNDINFITAILNGTTNFILSKMYNEGMNYKDALEIAQNLGFAEANPESDVLGYDTARKLAIISSITSDKRVDWTDIYTEGITAIDDFDIKCGKKLNCSIKLLAINIKEKDKTYVAVRPALVSNNGTLGNINNEYNGIFLEGDAVGEVFFSGKGAGRMPTASAVIGDIFDVLENKKQKTKDIIQRKEKITQSYPRPCDWALTITFNKESAIDELKSSLKEFNIINSSKDKISLLINSYREEELDDVIKTLNNKAVISVKKTLKLDI